MRVLVLGGTWFLGRRITERLHERGDAVLVVHRGRAEPDQWIPVHHLHTDRHQLADHAQTIAEFAPDAVVDSWPLTGADVDAVLPVLPEVPTVVLSSQDVYAAFTGLAVVLRLPMIYDSHDWLRREEPIPRRLRAHRRRIPLGAANLLWTRGHVDDLATGVLAAIDNRAADGLAVNLGEAQTCTLRGWFSRILAAADSDAELVTVPDTTLPSDLVLTAAPAQHLLISVTRAQTLLGWTPGDPATRVAESVRWHLAHPPPGITWTKADTAADDAALTHAP